MDDNTHTIARSAGDAAPAAAGRVLLRLRLIGPMAAWTMEPHSVLPAGRKTRALLAILAMAMPRSVPRTRLAELLWSGRPEEQSRASLRQELHRLQEALGAVGALLLHVTREQVGLKSPLVWTDTAELFQATNEHPSALALLDRELLEGMDGIIDPMFDQWLGEQRERLRLRARDLAEGLLAGVADPDMAMMAAQRLLSIDSAHEGAWRALIRGYALRGENGMAIQAFERCHAALAEHAGAAPSPETQQLVAQIKGTGEIEIPRADPPAMLAASVPSPRIGVLPPRLVGGGQTMLPLAVGLADEITSALSRTRWFGLVSSSALQRFIRVGEDERTMRAALGIDYLLDGSLQHAGTEVRLSMRLVDLAAGDDVIWTERFDGDATDLFELQDRLVAEIAARVEGPLLLAEARHGTADPTRPTQFLRAVPLMKRFERGDFARAGNILRQAMEQQPERADIFAWSALWHIFAFQQGWAPDPLAAATQAKELVVRAYELDPRDARVVAYCALVRGLIDLRSSEALALAERARLLNPYLPVVWAVTGLCRILVGDYDEAGRDLAECKRLAPLHPMEFLFDALRALHLLLERSFEACVVLCREVTELNRGAFGAYIYYVSALGHLGRVAEVPLLLERMAAIRDDFCITRAEAMLASGLAPDRALILEGLRLAGVPERRL